MPAKLIENTEAKTIIRACEDADWIQVVLNGGPPCFHLDDDRSFCFRAERWGGHDLIHKYVSLADFYRESLRKIAEAEEDSMLA